MKFINSNPASHITSVAIAALALMSASTVWAAGSANPGAGDPNADSTPRPVRPVVLKPVSAVGFHLPNGNGIQLSADLDALFRSAVTGTTAFAPTEGLPEDPCNTRIELRAALSTFELQVSEFGLTFGYSPAGEHPVLTNITGSVDVKVGAIAMDFSVWECTGDRCAAIAATTATHKTAKVTLGLRADFGVIHTGSSFIHNTSLAEAFRKIMTTGLARLSESSRLHELSWRAEVKEVNPDQGTLVFDAGQTERLAKNQNFVVYALTPSQGACELHQAIAYVRTLQVDTVSSIAIIEQALDDSRPIEPGDVVMVHSR